MGRKRRTYKYKDYELKSKAELEVAQNCDKKKLKWEYETETFLWNPPPPKVKRYTPDFVITRSDGTKFLVEYKEYLDAASKRKIRAMRTQHPDIEYYVLFGPKCSKKKISKVSKTTYGEWANKNNIKWGEGRAIPKEWL